MTLLKELTTALNTLPPSRRYDTALALAAHFTGLYMNAEADVSGGYVRKRPDRLPITLTDIVARIKEDVRDPD